MISYSLYKSTLKHTSKDTSSKCDTGNVEYMTDSLKEVVNFDDFQEGYLKDIHPEAKKPDSIDALCMLEDKWCLIEFKNGKVKYSDICNKIGSSVSIVTFKNNIYPKYFRENSIFILVYNKDEQSYSNESYEHFNERLYLKSKQLNYSTSFEFISNQVAKNSDEPIVQFKLKTFENVYFSKVMTMDKDIFNQYIQDKTITIPQD